MSKNQCPVCEKAYQFSTDGNGKLVVLHPITPCKPRVPNKHTVLTECMNCGDLFERDLDSDTPKPKKLCSEPCKREWSKKWHEKRRREDRLRRLRSAENLPLTKEKTDDTLALPL